MRRALKSLWRGLFGPDPARHPDLRTRFRRVLADASEHVDPLYMLTDTERRERALRWLCGEVLP